MAVIEYDSYKQKLLAMDETFENLFKALEIEQARQELNRLELEAQLGIVIAHSVCPQRAKQPALRTLHLQRAVSRACAQRNRGLQP